VEAEMLSKSVICLVTLVPLATLTFAWQLLADSPLDAGIELVYTNPKTPTIYLISVGVNNVKGLVQTNSERDASTFADEIEKRASVRIESGKDAGKSKLQKRVLLGSQATKANILSALDSAAREISSNDLFIFHFPGVGNGEPTKDFYLATSKFDQSKTGAEREKEFEENTISGEMLKAYFVRIRAKTKVLIFDTGISDFVCEQGNSFFSDQRDSNSLFIGTRTNSFDIVRKNNGGTDKETKDHGTVTGILLDAIRGDADSNYDGRVTAWETLAYFGNVKYDMNRDESTERNVEFCTSTKGIDFDLTLTDKALSETISRLQKNSKANEAPKAEPNRAEPLVEAKPANPIKKREGSDYAVLFAFDEYDTRWPHLSNPQNDTRDIARELRDRYKFKEVAVKPNLTLAEFENVIREYQNRKFNVDDQLFFFFAGHGTANEYNNGFLVAKDSPGVFDKRSKGYFISLDELLAEIDQIPSKHIMLVFDACFAGTLWHPSVNLVKSELGAYWDPRGSSPSHLYPELPYNAFSFSPSKIDYHDVGFQLTKDELVSRELADRSRVVLTSGWDVVKDGRPGSNSPFAEKFLDALRRGPDKNGLLMLVDIMSYVKRTPNKTPPELGIIGKQGETRSGGFVFCQGGCSADIKPAPPTR